MHNVENVRQNNDSLVAERLVEELDNLSRDLPQVGIVGPFPSLSPEQFDSLISSW